MIPLGKHFRGSRPGDINVVRALPKAGINTVANLERGYFETFHNEVNQLAEWTLSAGMVWTQVDLGDFIRPTFQEFDAVMTILSNPQYGRVYLCCLHGEDRTGVMSAAYHVLFESWDLNRAIQDLYLNGYHRYMYKPLGWTQQLIDYCNLRLEHPINNFDPNSR